MSRPLLVLRPEPGNAATVARAREMGLAVESIPLFVTRGLAWEAPDPAPYVGVLLTSGNALRFAGPQLSRYLHLPAFAVGQATMRLAQEAGFVSVVAGERDVNRLVARIATLGLQRLLHICGADVRPFDALGIEVDRCAVYSADPLDPGDALAAAIERKPVILVHSRRAAARLAEFVAPEKRASIILVAISVEAANGAGTGWEDVAIAAEPRDEALLREAARHCR